MSQRLIGLRRALAGLSVAVLLGSLALIIAAWEPIRDLKDLRFNALLEAGIQLKVEQSRSEFQLALLAMGALWGLVIAKKDEARIVLADAPEIVMFCCASVLLLASCVLHFLYVDGIAYVYRVAGGMAGGKSIPDVFAAGIENPFYFQFWLLLGGIAVAGFTLFSAYKMK